MKKFFKKENRGITLVALVITIIILLILAAISIQAITNTGLFAQAENAKRESEIASIKEQIALDIYEKQLEPPLGSITEEQIETILGKYGIVNKEDGKIVGITTAKGYEILLKDIYGGETVAELVPDGAIVTPVNDITTWLKTGEISNQYSYTTIEQVIADTTCTKSLMDNENAMKYLERSTEFANAICASETAMTYLGQSAYVDDTVLNSDNWKQTIKLSQYWPLVYASKTVTLYGAASETITIEGYYGSCTTGTDGSCSHLVPIDMITLTGSVSGKSFTRTITSDTTDVYVMPEGALYWYGFIKSGVSFNNFALNSGTSSNNFLTNYIDSSLTAGSYKAQNLGLETINTINLSGYSNLNWIGEFSVISGDGYLILGATDKSKSSGIYYNLQSTTIESTNNFMKVDVSSITDNKYIVIGAFVGGDATNKAVKIITNAIWFE